MGRLLTASVNAQGFECTGPINVGGTPGVSVSGVVWTLIGWFRVSGIPGLDFGNLYSEGITTDRSAITVQMRNNTGIPGELKFFYRPAGAATASFTIISVNAFNDGQWHWYVFQRTADNAHEAFVDGVSVGTSSTSVTTTYMSGTGTAQWGGNQLPAGSVIGPSWGAQRVIPIAQCREIAYGRMAMPSAALRMDALQLDRLYPGGPAVTHTGTPACPLTTDHPFPIVVPKRRYGRTGYTASSFLPEWATASNQILGWGPC